MLDLTQLSENELKALCYDRFRTINVCNQEIRLLEGELQRRAQGPPIPINTKGNKKKRSAAVTKDEYSLPPVVAAPQESSEGVE